MIVTADPLGDFNATSQILRYSALAREVTVPRVPSVASTIFSGTTKGGNFTSGRTTPTITVDEAVFAAQEIARLGDELEAANMRLLEEQNRRHEAELALEAAQERCVVVEQEIREEIFAEAEARLEEERERWKGAWYEEVSVPYYVPLLCSMLISANRLIETMSIWIRNSRCSRGLFKVTFLLLSYLHFITYQPILVYEDPDTSIIKRLEQLENENTALRRKLDQVERELHGGSPTKSKKKHSKQQSVGASPTKPPPAGGDSDVEHAPMAVQDSALQELEVGSPIKRKKKVSKQPSVGASPAKALPAGDSDSDVENTMMGVQDSALQEIKAESPTKKKKKQSKQQSVGASPTKALMTGDDSDIENTTIGVLDATLQELPLTTPQKPKTPAKTPGKKLR